MKDFKKIFLFFLFIFVFFNTSSLTFAKSKRGYPIQVNQEISNKFLYPGEQAKYTLSLVNLKDEFIDPDQAFLRFNPDEVEILPDFIKVMPEGAAKCSLEQGIIYCSEVTIQPSGITKIEFPVIMAGDETGEIDFDMSFRKILLFKRSYRDRREYSLKIHRKKPTIKTNSYFSSVHSFRQPVGTYNLDIKNFSSVNLYPEFSEIEIETDDMSIISGTLRMFPEDLQNKCHVFSDNEKIKCSDIYLPPLSVVHLQFDLILDNEDKNGQLEGKVELKSRKFDYEYETEIESILKGF